MQVSLRIKQKLLIDADESVLCEVSLAHAWDANWHDDDDLCLLPGNLARYAFLGNFCSPSLRLLDSDLLLRFLLGPELCFHSWLLRLGRCRLNFLGLLHLFLLLLM